MCGERKDLDALRSAFPLLERMTWLASAAFGPMPSSSLEAMAKVQSDMYRRLDRAAWERDYADEAREAVAALLSVDSQQIALVRSTSEGLIAAGTSVPWRRGDRVVITDQEYPANAAPWYHLARCHGLDVQVVRSVRDRLPVSAFAACVDHRTRVIAVSHVQFASGFRADLAGLADLARRHRALLVVDGIQSVGALELPVRELGVDVLACGGYKWLCGPLGTGFLYVGDRASRWLLPRGAGYEHLASQQRDELWEAVCGGGTWVRRTEDLIEGARRFDGLGHNCGLLAAFTESLKRQLELGPRWIEQRVMAVSAVLAEMARRAGYDVVTSQDDAERAGIVLFRGPWKLSEPAVRNTLEGWLRRRGIMVPLRAGGIRAGCHWFNDEDDLRKLFDALQAFPGTVG